MRNSRKNKMKKLLEQKLPYPQITVRADQRIDLALSMLPDREEALKEEASRKRPAHFKEEPAAQAVYFEEAPPLRRRLKMAAKCVFSLSALCFVCLFLFRWVLPNMAEAQRRAAQPDSSLSTAGSQSKPAWETESENAVTVDSFEKTENGLTLTMTLPVLPSFPTSTMTCLPEIRLRTDRGSLLELSSAYGILEAEAEAAPSTVEVEGAVSSQSEEGPARQDGYLDLSPGDPYTVTNVYMKDLTGVKQVVVTVYNFSTDAANATPWPDGTIHRPVVLGEFTLDLEAGEVKPSKTYEDLGLTAMSVSEYLEAFGADPEFKDHLWFGGEKICYAWEWEEDSDMFRPTCGFACYADTEDDLFYEVNFYLNGELYQTVPFYRTGEEEEFAAGRFKVRGEQFEKNDYLNLPDLWKDVVRRYYDIDIFLDELYPAEWITDDNNPLEDMDIYYEIVNIDTGEVLIDSRESDAGDRDGAFPSDFTSETKSQARSNDVELLEFKNFGGTLSLCVSYPAFSTTQLAAVDVHAINAETGQIGEEVPQAISEDPMYEEFQDAPPEGTQIGDSITERMVFGPLPEGTRQLVVRVRNVSEDEYVEIGDLRVESFVFAEFLIDLESGKAVPSDSYIAEWAEDGNSPYDLQSISEYAATLLCATSGYEGWFEQQFLGSMLLSNYGIDKNAPNMMLQFYSDVNIDLPMEAQFYVDDELARTVPLYRTGDSVDVENRKHPAMPDYETRREDSFLRVDPQHKLYYEDGSTSTKRLYIAIAMFDNADYEDYWSFYTVRVKVVCTLNGDVLYDSGDSDLA